MAIGDLLQDTLPSNKSRDSEIEISLERPGKAKRLGFFIK
jgi:hypothetical protein